MLQVIISLGFSLHSSLTGLLSVYMHSSALTITYSKLWGLCAPYTNSSSRLLLQRGYSVFLEHLRPLHPHPRIQKNNAADNFRGKGIHLLVFVDFPRITFFWALQHSAKHKQVIRLVCLRHDWLQPSYLGRHLRPFKSLGLGMSNSALSCS